MSEAAVRTPDVAASKSEPRWPLVLALVLLAAHVFLATRNWHAGFLPGNEFRQTQTALSALFIERTGDYGLAYPTPLFGPPWSVPMEFPLYQWCVAALTTLTGWSIAESGRTVSLACFYLALPALFLLLRSFGLSRPRVCLALAAVLATPIHIFYSRAVLIESMALAFAVWFAAAYFRAVQGRHFGWAAVAVLAAIGASLAKITTLMAWMVGPAVVTAWWLGEIFRETSPLPARVRRALTVAAWGLGCAVPAIVTGAAWVHFSDAVKAASPGGAWLQSGPLAGFTFGAWHDRVDPIMFAGWIRHLGSGVLPWWTVGLVAVAGAFVAGRERKLALGLLAWFVAVLAVFPRLYSFHDYYFVSTAALFVVAAALCAGAWLGHRQRWVAPVLMLVLVGSQLSAYARHYAALQNVPSNGGSGLTNFLRDMTPADSVLIIVGADWQPVIPYHAERRSVMIRSDLVSDEAYLNRVLASLRREDVVAFLAVGEQRTNSQLRAKFIDALQLEPQVAVSTSDTDVYLARRHLYSVVSRLRQYPNYSDVTARADPGPPPQQPVPPLSNDGQIHSVTPRQARFFFPGMSHPPSRYRCTIGIGPGQQDGKLVLGAHPESELWVEVPASARQVDASFGLPKATYERDGDKTDGVRFAIVATLKSGQTVTLLDRLLAPATVAADRGDQTVLLTIPAGTTTLLFRTTPNANLSFDWAYWGHIRLVTPTRAP